MVQSVPHQHIQPSTPPLSVLLTDSRKSSKGQLGCNRHSSKGTDEWLGPIITRSVVLVSSKLCRCLSSRKGMIRLDKGRHSRELDGHECKRMNLHGRNGWRAAKLLSRFTGCCQCCRWWCRLSLSSRADRSVSRLLRSSFPLDTTTTLNTQSSPLSFPNVGRLTPLHISGVSCPITTTQNQKVRVRHKRSHTCELFNMTVNIPVTRTNVNLPFSCLDSIKIRSSGAWKIYGNDKSVRLRFLV